ncbi:MAG TPA: DSD1 family PLP-dependent enzyme [Hyphomicrobiaceae bacterium]|nr:DSD1 family PLP-dependent enzyme [Hyphomicrobiaceae bacterium]
MSMPPPARVGDPVAEIDTPALVIDLDAMERNIARLAAFAAKTGVKLRPHAKTHKSPDIGRRQIAAGAVGLCCQKVSEAEAMVAGGIGDVLVSNEVFGARKLDRLASLSRRATVAVCADNVEAIEAIAAAAGRQGVRITTLVEIDVGANRCGVAPGEPAVVLARLIASKPNLKFGGLQAYQGRAQHLRTIAERRAAIDHAIEVTRRTVELLEATGLPPAIVGGAGTGTYDLEGSSGVYTELQAGSYVFMDADYARNKRADGRPYDTFEHALFVIATVMSLPVAERAVIDAGLKTFATDAGMPEPRGLDGASYIRPSDEHGIIDLTKSNHRLALGDRVALIPGHCDPTVNLHDWYVGVRGYGTPNAHVECLWPVAARGAIF